MCNPISNTSSLPAWIESQTMLNGNADIDVTFCAANDNGNVSQVHSYNYQFQIIYHFTPCWIEISELNGKKLLLLW